MQADKADFGVRLKEVLGDRDMAWLSRETGIPTSTLSDYGKGKLPRVDKALQIAQALGLSVDSLLKPGADGFLRNVPAGAMRNLVGPTVDMAVSEDPDEVAIDSIDLSYGLGGTFVDVEPGAMEIEKARFSRRWLRKFTNSPPQVLFTTSGVGDSMRPTIEDHDVVIVDRSARLQDELGEKVWAVVFAGIGMIKRVRRLPDGTVKLMSDNQSVRDEVATDNDLYIVGRVVAVVRRH